MHDLNIHCNYFVKLSKNYIILYDLVLKIEEKILAQRGLKVVN